MLKRTLSALILSAFTASTLTACGSNVDSNMTLLPETTGQTVQAESYKGVSAEITKSITANFKQLDANKDKFVSPSEYGLNTPEQVQAFNDLDDNGDGKITLKEMLPNFFSKVGMTLRIQKAADALFGQLDKNKNKYLSQAEMNSSLISAAYLEAFKKYDKEKQWWFFNKGTKANLSKSEFQNMFAHIAMTAVSEAPAPAPAPVDPAPAPADPAAPTTP